MAKTKSPRLCLRASLALLCLTAGAPAIAAASTPAVTADAPRLALVAVDINGIGQPEPAWILREAGGVYVTIATAKLWRFRAEGVPTRVFDGDPYIALAGVPGVALTLDEASQTLHLVGRPDSFDASAAALSRRLGGAMTRRDLGGFLNYDLSGQRNAGTTALNGLFELGAFSPIGTFGTSFIAGTGRDAGGGRAVVRLDSNWTIDDPARMRSLRIGDGVSRGSAGTSSLRFAGIQLATNFATQPGYLTMALPTLNGSAAVPSVVDIYVNNVLQNHQNVAPGAFSLTDIPVVSGSGEVQLVVRDVLGRETLVSQSYYATPQILRRGLHDYSYEIGLLRRDYTVASNHYGAAMLSATHRYGATEQLTLEAHAEVARTAQTTSLRADTLWPGIGIFSLAVAGSRSVRGTGGVLYLGFERQARRLSLGFNGEVTTDAYATIGETTLYRRPRSTVTGFIGVPTAFGSAAGSVVWRRGRGQPDVLYASANASMRIGGIGALGLRARQSFAVGHDQAIELFLSVPLGGRTSATVGTGLRDGVAGANATLQRSLPYGNGTGFRLQAETGAVERLSGEVNAQAGFGRLDAQVTRLDDQTGVRIGLSGSLATVGGQVFAARPLEQSFAAVQVGDYDSVRVYANNQLVGRTNAAGVLIVPRLLPYQDNHLRIEAEDLPLDATIDETLRTVRPYDHSGVAIRFDAHEARGAVLRIVDAHGLALPAGTTLRVDGNPATFLVAPGGQAYLTGLSKRNRVTATLAAGTCRFVLTVPAASDPQPDLGSFACIL